jgi:hypothetical protein
LLKYYYKPLDSALAGTKLELVGKEDTIFVVVRAESRDDAFELAQAIINMNNWELSHSEE